MVVDIPTILEAVEILLQNAESSKTIKKSLQTGGITATGTFVGSALFGPLGIVVGTAIVASACYIFTRNTYKSLLEVYRNDMDAKARKELAEKVLIIMDKFTVQDAIMLLQLVSGKQVVDGTFLKQLFVFVKEHIEDWQRNQTRAIVQ